MFSSHTFGIDREPFRSELLCAGENFGIIKSFLMNHLSTCNTELKRSEQSRRIKSQILKLKTSRRTSAGFHKALWLAPHKSQRLPAWFTWVALTVGAPPRWWRTFLRTSESNSAGHIHALVCAHLSSPLICAIWIGVKKRKWIGFLLGVDFPPPWLNSCH